MQTLIFPPIKCVSLFFLACCCLSYLFSNLPTSQNQNCTNGFRLAIFDQRIHLILAVAGSGFATPLPMFCFTNTRVGLIFLPTFPEWWSAFVLNHFPSVPKGARCAATWVGSKGASVWRLFYFGLWLAVSFFVPWWYFVGYGARNQNNASGGASLGEK